MQSFLQSPSWATFNETLGTHTLLAQNVLYLQRSFQFGTYFLSSRCVIPENYEVPTFKSKPCFIRLEPENALSLVNLQNYAKQHSLQLVPTVAVQPRQSILVSLGSEEEILQRMKQKHRYNTRLSLKHGLHHELFSTYNEAGFQRFWKLLSKTAKRQGFNTHAREYYKIMEQTFSKAHVLVISHEGTDLAAMLLLTYSDTATYLHGASDDTMRNLMAPYYMHFIAMQHARIAGCTTYDLWGSDLVKVPNSETWEPQDGHASAGTSRFKTGFGGTVVEYPGTFDLILQPFCYTLYKTVRSLRGGKRAFQ